MMTLPEWHNREDLRVAWADLLKNNEALRSALDVCLSTEIDGKPLMRDRGGDLVQAQALEGARREGYLQCLRYLKALALPATPREELPGQWVGKKSVREAGR